MSAYRTIAAGAEPVGEFTDRKSRFIAQLRHVESEAEAQAFIAEVRAKHYDARHNVFAYALADGFERQSDDGEPSRTSGMPTLDVLRGAELKDTICVTTRYFGGTLLGPGGLVRAYTAAAQEAVAAAESAGQIVVMTEVTPVDVTVDYPAYEQVRHLAETSGGKIADQQFTDRVALTVVFRSGEEAPFLAATRELACGREIAVAREPEFGEF